MSNLWKTYSSAIRKSRGSSVMAPPPSTTSSGGAPAVHPAIRDVTEDTPVDLLEGTMELLVILPSTSTLRTTVERKTPMMDLLIQLGTVNKLNPGDHIVQVRNERGFELPYKPSTPIGALDTSTIEVVPKNRVTDYIIVKKPSRVANQPFEHTFRLQVHLPRNQLYVMRVSMKTVLQEILKEVCQEKNLDILKYEIRHPGNLDERLPLHGTLGQFGLHEITVVSKNTKVSSSVSTADIIALQQTNSERGNNKGYLDSSFKHSKSSVGDSSVSSGSTGSGRGLSPTQSDDSRSVSPSPFAIHSSAKLSHQHRQRPNSGSSSDVNRAHAPPLTSVHKSISMSNMFSPRGVSVSPALGACSGGSEDGHPPLPPRHKKRAAPLPPPLLKSLTVSCMNTSRICNGIEEKQDEGYSDRLTPKKKEAPRAPTLTKSSLTSSATQLNQSATQNLRHHSSNHSRHSSGSSVGCGNEGVSDSTQHELHNRYGYDRQSSAPAMLSRQVTARSASNLTTTSSISNTSLASSSGCGSKKRRAPVPPNLLPLLKPQSEIDEENYNESGLSLGGPVGATVTASSGGGADSDTSLSDKQSGQRQSSVEVEVDVHYRKNSYTNTPISINTSKDEDNYSSTPVSSLSSPGSYLSNSSTSSPLPPNLTEISTSKEYGSSSSTPPITHKSNFCKEASEPGTGNIMQSSTDDDSVSTQALAPLPPPRRTRELVPEPEKETSQEPPQAKPRPKPRLDRKSNEDPPPTASQFATRKSTSSTDRSSGAYTDSGDEEKVEKVEVQPVLASSQLRNPLSKYGVKVLPDNVLKERADRLAKAASIVDDERERRNKTPPTKPNGNDGGSISSRSKKTSAPPPPTSTPPNAKPPLPPSSKNSAFQLRQRESSDSSSAPESSSRPNKSNKQQTTNSLDEDSDNLEENMELFEPVGSVSKRNSNLDPPKSLVSIFTPTGVPSQSSMLSQPNAPETLTLPPEEKTECKISSSVSDFQEMERKAGGGDVTRVREQELVRTNSDRLKNNSKLSPSDNGKLLNRWQNQESLNEFNDNDSPSANVASNYKTTNKLRSEAEDGVDHNTPSSAHFTKRSKPPSSKKLLSDDLHEGTFHSVEINQEDDAGHTSSESEVSYTDSGIPTTETITPSPMDFDARISDHEDDGESPTKEQLSGSRGSSNRSSFQSDEGDQWRNVLEKKAQNSHEVQEKTFASMLPQSLNDVTPKKDKDHPKRSPYESSDYHRDSANSFTDEDQRQPVKEVGSRRSSSDSSSSRKLSKSESFSHNSEFDFVQMKRKQFSASKGAPLTYSSNLSKSSHHSSSEDDLRLSKSHNSNESADSSAKNQSNSNVIRRSNEDKGDRSLQKTTSLYEMQNLNSDSSIKQDPELMKAFHSQLEAQFEQWKVDFLKKQEVDSQPTIMENDASAPIQSGQMKMEGVNGEQKDVKDNLEEKANSVMEPRFVESASSVSSITPERETPPTATVTLRKPAPNTEYKYTGPPTVNMGAWTERPKSTVSVKKDSDYIMGFGQASPKVAEPKPYKQLPRNASFTQNPTNSLPAPQKRSPQVISPTFRSIVEAVSPAKTTSNPINPPTKGLSATLNARPASSVDSVDSVSTIKSVLSTWKQRVNNEDLSKGAIPQGHPPEIDIYENEGPNTFTRTPNQKLINFQEAKESAPKDSVKIVADERKLKIVDLGANVNINVSRSKFDQPHPVSTKQATSIEPVLPVVISKEPSITTTPKKVVVSQEPIQIKTDDRPDSGRPKPIFKIASMESKTNKILAQAQQSDEKPSVQASPPLQNKNVALRKSGISLDISFPENSNGLTMKDRKSYFQGVAPVESPSKEMPLPAVNMKNSIATIQKVFEQRKAQSSSPSPSPTSTLQRSQTVTPTKSESIIIVETEPVVKVNSTPTPAVQPIPRQFSMMTSSEMVQRALGKSSKPAYEAFRRSPSPMSSTTSTLSRTSSSGRDTPSSDGVETSVRISNEVKKPISAPLSNIQNVGNKSVIIVQAEPTSDSSSIPVKGSVSNNVFKLQNSINIGSGSKKESLEEVAPLKRKPSFTSTTIVINGNSSSPAEKSVVNERRESWNNSGKLPQVSISNGGESGRKMSSSEPRAGSNLPPMSGNAAAAPPPPPPLPSPDMQFMRPKPVSLNFSSRPKSENVSSSFSSPSSNSKSSTPSSPNGSDPRNEIFSAIKNSNGNFGLKKTGSTFLLKK